MAKKFDIQYYFSEGFHSIFTHGFMSFAAVCMIVACLLIMGSFTLVAVNLDNMLGDLEAENEFLAYVDETYTEEQARDMKSQIEAIPNVSQVTFVTRAEALDDFRAGRESNELLADLPDEVLRDRFRIHVQDIKQLRATSEQVQKITGVADVNAAYDIAQGFVLVRNIATGVAVVLVAMLAVVSLFIIANTIKLAFFYRREEIAIMKMCGATNSFIRWPFIVEGMLQSFGLLYFSVFHIKIVSERISKYLGVRLNVSLVIFRKGTLKQSGFGRVVRIAVVNAASQADNPVAETCYRFAGHEIRCKVRQLAFRKFHGKKSVFSFQRTASREVFLGTDHSGTLAWTVEQVKRKVNSGGAWQPIPVPTFFFKAATLTGYRFPVAHQQDCSVTLVTSVAVVFLIDFSSPYIRVIAF